MYRINGIRYYSPVTGAGGYGYCYRYGMGVRMKCIVEGNAELHPGTKRLTSPRNHATMYPKTIASFVS